MEVSGKRREAVAREKRDSFEATYIKTMQPRVNVL